MLPVGFLLTMYTETGYDASAHTAEETTGAAVSAAQGVWRSVFYSSIIGWILLLSFLFAANDVAAVNDAAGYVGAIFDAARSTPGRRRWCSSSPRSGSCSAERLD